MSMEKEKVDGHNKKKGGGEETDACPYKKIVDGHKKKKKSGRMHVHGKKKWMDTTKKK